MKIMMQRILGKDDIQLFTELSCTSNWRKKLDDSQLPPIPDSSDIETSKFAFESKEWYNVMGHYQHILEPIKRK